VGHACDTGIGRYGEPPDQPGPRWSPSRTEVPEFPGMSLEYSPHSLVPHRPAGTLCPLSSGLLNTKNKTLPSSFTPKTKRNLVCLLANLWPCSLQQLGSEHVQACIYVCPCMCSCMGWPRPGHELWEYRWLAPGGLPKSLTAPVVGCPGDNESMTGIEVWEIPVGRDHGSWKRSWGLSGSDSIPL
jgi:hypothetical protein